MIARVWKGWTAQSDADRYEIFLKTKILPRLKNVEGYFGGLVLRREEGTEVEFAVLNFFGSIDGVKRFAGQDYDVPVIEPEARLYLSRSDKVAMHYEVKENTLYP